MSKYTADDQWRSFQTFIAAYVAGMLHPRDVLTISRREKVSGPLVEFRCDATGLLWFSIGDDAWSDDDDAAVQIPRGKVNDIALHAVGKLRGLENVDGPDALRLSGSGPASSVSVLARGGFFNFGKPEDVHPAQKAAHEARMYADIDVEGDVIEEAAQAEGSSAFAGTKSGSIAAIACAAALARLRNWVDPFTPTPKSGYLVGGQPMPEMPDR